MWRLPTATCDPAQLLPTHDSPQATRALFGGGAATKGSSIYDYTVKSIDGKVRGAGGHA